jgi:hypothetical protein
MYVYLIFTPYGCDSSPENFLLQLSILKDSDDGVLYLGLLGFGMV